MKSISILCTIALMLMSAAGCQQRAASKLQGRWEGRPDTAAARAKRESKKYGKLSADRDVSADRAISADRDKEGSATKTNSPVQVTDWEKYDLTVLMDFVSNERVEMSLGNGEQPQSGSWKVVSTSPAGCAIEVQTESDGEPANVERRRFELLFDKDEGTCVGFQLTEAGADRLQGALYFKRPDFKRPGFQHPPSDGAATSH